jgi:hypothetical protein
MLFTEQSPRHYSSEMLVAKLDYAVSGKEKRAKTEALLKGEISSTPEAQRLIDSLESRMERKYLNESLAATKHFLKSLNTPNDELRFKNGFDHSELYKRLAPSEKDYVYEMANRQKEQLEATAQTVIQDMKKFENDRNESTPSDLQVEKLQEVMKTELKALSVSGAGPEVVQERTILLLNDHIGKTGVTTVDKQKVQLLSKELSEIIIGNDIQRSSHYTDVHRGSHKHSEIHGKGETRNLQHSLTRA